MQFNMPTIVKGTWELIVVVQVAKQQALCATFSFCFPYPSLRGNAFPTFSNIALPN